MTTYKEQFISNSYDNWAYRECMRYIASRIDMEPIEACDEFRHQMDMAACEAKTEQTKAIFVSAYEAALHILDDMIIERESGGKGGYII